MEIDLVRGDCHNVLSNLALKSALQSDAKAGQIRAILAGPNCRTWSRLRFRTPGANPVRARNPAHDWAGLPRLSQTDREKVQTDNLLFEFFFELADEVYKHGGLFFLEHPSDPGAPYPSIWACSKVRAWLNSKGAVLHHFDA
eukprot:5748897-Amphidinium_carterae.1